MPRPAPPDRAEFVHFLPIGTRWLDNDVYGHVNNIVYYSFFDTAVNSFLIARGLLDIERGDVIGLVVETACRFFRPLSFPQHLEVGLRVDHLGNSSVRYGMGVFSSDEPLAAAEGHFVHVYVDRDSRRPRPLPEALRAGLEVLRTG
ncbi:MAG: thioesterase family protein [Gemmatimonadota bacterium]